MTTLPTLQAGLTHLDYFQHLDKLDYPYQQDQEKVAKVAKVVWVAAWPGDQCSQVVKVVNVIRAQVEVVN